MKENKEKLFDSLFQEYNDTLPGFSLGIFHGLTPIYTKSIGVASKNIGSDLATV